MRETLSIDVIIPNYNGAAHLPVCLASLQRQTRGDARITVVDDASTDGSAAVVAAFSGVRWLALPHNLGFAAAANAAIAATDGDVVVLLNNDTEASPGWLAALVGALEADPTVAFAASKLMLFDERDRIHSAGDTYRADGVPGNRGVWQRDTGQYDDQPEVFGPCAGAAAYRRSALAALAEAGRVFDEDLVMYCEDVDLNLRARRQGLRTRFVPEAVVYHRLSATGGGRLASYYCGRNFLLVWAKNMPAPLARRHWWRMLRTQLRLAGEAAWHSREPAARARLAGQLAGLRALPRFIAKRQPLDDAGVSALQGALLDTTGGAS
jgi:GT2 family glycosyltransferase